jgi:hypothetical protein
MLKGIPEFRKFREVVDNIRILRNRTLIRMLYLTASRVSEIVTKTSPWERKHGQTKPFGNYLDFGFTDFKNVKVLLIKIALSKRRGKLKAKDFRVVALPCKLEYEPWILDILKYIQARKMENKRPSFDLTRQRVGQIVKKELHMLGSNVNPNKLRTYRIAHLVNEYGFDQYDLMAYLGMQIRTSPKLTELGIIDTSPTSAVSRYFSKLLKPIHRVRNFEAKRLG